MRVIAVQECFMNGSRRRVGAVFEVDEDDFLSDVHGPVLPQCLMPASDPDKAAKRIAELQAKPYAAAAASSGSMRIRPLGNPRRP